MANEHTAPTSGYHGREGRRRARFFSSWFRAMADRSFGSPMTLALEFLDLQRTDKVIDAGSGSGFYTLKLAEKITHGRVLAMDSSPEMLRELRKRVEKKHLARIVEVLQCDILDVPMADESADAAVCLFVWHYIENPVESAAELFRLIRPGGKVFVADFHTNGEVSVKGHHSSRHDRTFTPVEMKEALTAAGFTGVRAETLKKCVLGYGIRP